MKIIKKTVAMFLCMCMVCFFSSQGAFAAEKATGFHALNKNVESPKVAQDSQSYARASTSTPRYYSSRDLGHVTSVKNQGNT